MAQFFKGSISTHALCLRALAFVIQEQDFSSPHPRVQLTVLPRELGQQPALDISTLILFLRRVVVLSTHLQTLTQSTHRDS